MTLINIFVLAFIFIWTYSVFRKCKKMQLKGLKVNEKACNGNLIMAIYYNLIFGACTESRILF